MAIDSITPKGGLTMHKKDMDTLDLFNELMFQKFAVDRTSLIHRMMGLSVLAYVALFLLKKKRA